LAQQNISVLNHQSPLTPKRASKHATHVRVCTLRRPSRLTAHTYSSHGSAQRLRLPTSLDSSSIMTCATVQRTEACISDEAIKGMQKSSEWSIILGAKDWVDRKRRARRLP